jgi:hypothetical protein
MSAAMAQTTNGICEMLPAGNPTYAFYEAQTSGSTPRPDHFTFTVPSGIKRALFVAYMEENNGNSGDYPVNISYGGQSMTETANSVSYTNSSVPKFLNVHVYFLPETGINSATSDTFSVSYYESTPKSNASYAFVIFAVDEAKQNVPQHFCGAQQTGGNLARPDSLSCDSTSTFASGDLFLAVGAAGAQNAGPLSSNYSSSLMNTVSNGMVDAVFYNSMTGTTTLTPYMTTNGTNAGRFSMLAIQVEASPITTLVLPIQLESFDAQAGRSGNILRWTSTENNMCVYNVERSDDGQNFYGIGIVQSRTINASTSRQSYSFTDAAPFARSFYRLRISDINGRYFYSRTVSVTNGGFETVQSMPYPNPATGAFTITGLNTDAQVKVLNAYGQQMNYSITDGGNAGQKRVQLLQSSPGFYYVYWISDGRQMSARLLIQ